MGYHWQTSMEYFSTKEFLNVCISEIELNNMEKTEGLIHG
jgi:hypothetical protein